MEEKVKFGFSQLKKQTPEFAKIAFRIVLYSVAILNFVVMTVTEIPQGIKDAINHYSLYAVAFAHFISKMFGLDCETLNVEK